METPSYVFGTESFFTNVSDDINSSASMFHEPRESHDPLYVVIPVTFIYVLIFITGIIGNISTCIVIFKNKSMHTATNYYLFSLAISDFILLISGVPQEVYYVWYRYSFIFGESYCILRGLAAETSANATVLTITAFTIERYVAICYPFLSHTMSKLSRAIKFIFFIWILSITFAIPQAIQFGIVGPEGNEQCTIVHQIIEHSFELATVLFFFTPMTIIFVLYLLIGIKLRSNTLVKRENGSTMHRSSYVSTASQQTSQSTKRVIKMLVAVVVAFFICWAPFHAQRLAYTYFSGPEQPSALTLRIFDVTTYISGILYHLSTCINPLLYNVMSNKFRQAFKETLAKCFTTSKQQDYQERSYRSLTRSQRHNYGPDSSSYSGTSAKEASLFSSASQKQSIDVITVSRNNFVKQHSLVKPRVDNLISSNFLPANVCMENPHSCLTSNLTNSKVNLSSQCNVNVSFQRCDSILHISIGNSSKVTKRNKNKFGFLSKLRIFSRKRKAKRQCQMFFTSQIANENTYHMDDDSLNIINDDLMITINKGSQISEMAVKSTLIQSSHSSVSSAGKEHKSTQSCDVNCNENSLHYNFDKMDNELDDYMREIKRREMM
ncbi:unnamed protein product [Diamesa serratosioi]